MSSVQSVKREKLSPQQAKLFQVVLAEASADPFLFAGDERSLLGDRTCFVVLLDQVPVGFYTPKSQSFLGVIHWRAGTLFLVKRARGKGIMQQALSAFFDSHQPGLSWIADKNTASQRLFTALGFVKGKLKVAGWGEAGHWWIRPKQQLSTEQLHVAPPIYTNW